MLIFFQGVLQALRAGMKASPGAASLCNSFFRTQHGQEKEISFGKKYKMCSVLPLLRGAAVCCSGTCCHIPYARNRDGLPGARCHRGSSCLVSLTARLEDPGCRLLFFFLKFLSVSESLDVYFLPGKSVDDRKKIICSTKIRFNPCVKPLPKPP